MAVTTRLTETRCPWCEHRLDAATGTDDEPHRPEPGDLSVCIMCASILMFDQELIPQKISEDERKLILLAQPDLVETLDRAQRSVRSIDRRRPPTTE